MLAINAPWTTWWQDDLPCRFSQDEAARNCEFLTEFLGQKWLERAAGPNSSHPLISEWTTNGANAFLLLNALAEDARLLTSAPGFDTVVEDLRDGKQCRSAWHVIRTAAMFARGGAAVVEFFKQTDVKVPDFALQLSSAEVNVEAKLLLESDAEEAFMRYAVPICDQVLSDVMAQEKIHPPVIIVFKDNDQLPVADDVVRRFRHYYATTHHPQKNDEPIGSTSS